MFPFRDHNPSSRWPFVTWALIAVNVAVFLIMLPAMGNERELYRIYNTYALVPAEFMAGYDRWTLLTSMFMHAGWMHLLGNMLFLYVYGDNLEDQLGHVPFLLFYLAAGAAGDLAQIAADPNSRVANLGASGAIAGVMGGYLLLFPRAKIDILLIIVIFIRIITLPAFAVLGFWFGLQLVMGWGSSAAGGGVAYWAHAGGFAAGLLLILPLWLRRGGPRFWNRTDGHPPNPAAVNRWSGTRVPQVARRR